MRQEVTSYGWNPDRRLQRGRQAAEARAALFTRAPEDEEAGRPDGCLWCRCPVEAHQWDYAPDDGNTRRMRLNWMECFACAAALSTHQAICYKRRGYEQPWGVRRFPSAGRTAQPASAGKGGKPAAEKPAGRAAQPVGAGKGGKPAAEKSPVPAVGTGGPQLRLWGD